MDRLEEEHGPSVHTTPIPHKRRATDKTFSTTPQVNIANLFQNSSNSKNTTHFGVETRNIPRTGSTTPFSTETRTLRARERISTPIEESQHILVSPTADLPAFSPVNLTSSIAFNADNGRNKTSKQNEKESQSSRIVVNTEIDVLVSPIADLPAFSPVNLMPSKQNIKFKQNEEFQSSNLVVNTDAGSETEKIHEQRNDSPR